MSKRYANPPEREVGRGTSHLKSRVETILEELSSEPILVPQPAEIFDYLLRYPDMISLLPSVCKSASEVFQEDSQLALEVYRDPEIEDEYLALYVRQKSYGEDIMDKIERISTEYEDELCTKAGWLLVTTDFRPPI